MTIDKVAELSVVSREAWRIVRPSTLSTVVDCQAGGVGYLLCEGRRPCFSVCMVMPQLPRAGLPGRLVTSQWHRATQRAATGSVMLLERDLSSYALLATFE